MPAKRSRKKQSAPGSIEVTPIPGSEADPALLSASQQPGVSEAAAEQPLPAGLSAPSTQAPAAVPAASSARLRDGKLRRSRRQAAPAVPVQPPAFRRLQVYAFDPSLSLSTEYVGLNRAAIKVAWESRETPGQCLAEGPVGEYVEVVDVDPASQCCYKPVDLDAPYLLAQDGLAPAEGNPQFHQQMVYAVVMRTIANFEHSLGRRVIWSPRCDDNGEPLASPDDYVRRLRIYPHALREPNAYYSPVKKALLFGYFPAAVTDVRFHLPGGMVFTCLSHDVVAHETTHAILDGMHRRFLNATNPDMLAFHEAFADISALFQHFSMPEVLEQQIARTRGDLECDNLLAQLAQEFGSAIGQRGALRDALGYKDDKGSWHRSTPDPSVMLTETEPHARGSLLVSAVFDAFIAIYRLRTADLLRIATSGSGVLPQGQLHPDLVKRLSNEAAKAAQHVLNMCVRAIDYCPPVDLTFGDYLRALITADYDLVRDDDLGYRVAIVDAFRQHGIYPRGLRSLSDDTLRWRQPEDEEFLRDMHDLMETMRQTVYKEQYVRDRQKIYDLEMCARARLQDDMLRMDADLAGLLGLLPANPGESGATAYRVDIVRPAHRIGPDGQVLNDLVITITQSVQEPVDPKWPIGPTNSFDFIGGCTLLVDLNEGIVRYCISKSLSHDRLARQQAYFNGDVEGSLRATYFGAAPGPRTKEPFAFLHRMGG